MNKYLIAFAIVGVIFLAVMFLCVMATAKGPPKSPMDLQNENLRRLLNGKDKL